MGQIGDCERNLWAGLNGIPEDKEISPRVLVLFGHGNVIESHVIALLRDAGYLVEDRESQSGKQFQCLALDGRLVGYIDGTIMLGDIRRPRKLLLEIKSANEKQFEVARDVGYEAWNPKYAAQLQVYMGCSDLAEALAVVYCKNTSDMYAERIKFNSECFSELLEKADRVLLSSELLPRPEAAKSQYCGFCKYCSRNAWCWSPLRDANFDD